MKKELKLLLAFSVVLSGLVVEGVGNALASAPDEEGYMEFIQVNESVFKIELEDAESYIDEEVLHL